MNLKWLNRLSMNIRNIRATQITLPTQTIPQSKMMSEGSPTTMTMRMNQLRRNISD